MFGSDSMAEGYAKARPPVHERILAQARAHLSMALPARWALDLGCGSGVSTRAVRGLAQTIVGIEPEHSMLCWARKLVPDAHFATAAAERLPLTSESIDLVTAAGSLNFADVEQALPEIRRVLAPTGSLVIYDFSQGAEFPHSIALANWHAEFKTRYPSPPPARPFDPKSLPYAPSGLKLDLLTPFADTILLSPEFYLNYAMTETNVAAAVSRGIPESEIRRWCEQSLAPVFDGAARDVVFRGYFACVSRA